MQSSDSVGMEKGAGIVVRPYDEAWPLEFERVREELIRWLAPWIISVDHVGSTSVPGLEAKPIVDILVGVPDLVEALAVVPTLESLGFEYRAKDDLPDRHYFPRTLDGLRKHHVSLAEPSSRYSRNTLIFRDALRVDPEIARRYAVLKRRLAEEVGTVRLAYLNGKTDFVLEVLAAHGGEVGGNYPSADLGSSAV